MSPFIQMSIILTKKLTYQNNDFVLAFMSLLLPPFD